MPNSGNFQMKIVASFIFYLPKLLLKKTVIPNIIHTGINIGIS